MTMCRFLHFTPMPGLQHGPSILRPRTYDALRKRGYSKARAAAISNAQAAGTIDRKAANFGARAGQTIAGALGRGGDGKFTRVGGASSSVKPAKAAPKGKQPKKSEAERAAEGNAKRAARQAERAAEREQAKQDTYRKLNIAPDGQAAMEALRKGEGADADAIARAGLEDAGLVERDSEGKFHLTASGRATVNAAAQGDTGRAGDTIAGARSRIAARRARTAEQERKKREREAKPKAGSGGGRSNSRSQQQSTAMAARQRRLAERQRKLQEQIAAAQRRSTIGKSFQVFKDAKGQPRWLMVSSTAYQDKDAEIVTRKALAGAVALGDSTGYRGPLRFWHVPGLDLGECDYQALAHDGRWLVESGTFKSAAIAQAVAKHASRYRASIGFTHPDDEPGADKTYNHIVIFERSLVPAERASNPFTRVSVKERKGASMLTTEKQAEWDALAKGNPEMAEMMLSLLKQTASTDKAAQGRVAYKEQAQPAAADTIVVNGVTYKAMPAEMMEEKAPPMGEELTDAVDDLDKAAEDADSGGMDDAGFAQMVAQAVIDAIAPLLDMEKKMSGYVNEMKGLLSGGTTKEATFQTTTPQADLLVKMQQQFAAFETQLKELQGDQPAMSMSSNRSSQADETVLDGAALAEIALKNAITNPAGATWLENFSNKYFDRLQGGTPQ